ncbi:MAG: 3-hydroxyacyl-CoA dehydrogenase family protein [Planctomycetes bacterium]|nr:3-hydroxyacyl-CoA dehydrogenase family protein [Planctomycetota bacterium]
MSERAKSETNQFGTVAVLGAGTMGAGIAQVCAQAGSRVILYDVEDRYLERGMQTIHDSLDKGVEKGKLTAPQRAATLERIDDDLDLARAVAEAELVIEAVPEKLELKREVFAQVAQASRPGTVLATNTSSLALARIFAGIADPGRCIGMHFFNPVPIMALLEIVRPAGCSDATLERVRAYAGTIGKEPIVVKDSPGFATSRLGVCIGLEAIRMVEAGVASAQDIDKAMELGYRHPMGPLRLTDLVGLDVRLSIAEYLRQELDSPVFEAPKLMREMVARGQLGKKSGKGFYDWS